MRGIFVRSTLCFILADFWHARSLGFQLDFVSFEAWFSLFWLILGTHEASAHDVHVGLSGCQCRLLSTTRPIGCFGHDQFFGVIGSLWASGLCVPRHRWISALKAVRIFICGLVHNTSRHGVFFCRWYLLCPTVRTNFEYIT